MTHMLIASKIKIELLRPSAHQVNSQIAWRCKQKSLFKHLELSFVHTGCTLQFPSRVSERAHALAHLSRGSASRCKDGATRPFHRPKNPSHTGTWDTNAWPRESYKLQCPAPFTTKSVLPFFLSFCFADCLFTNTDLMKINYKQLTCSLTTQKRHIDSKACGEFSITMARVMSLAPSKSILQNPSAAWKAGEAGKLFWSASMIAVMRSATAALPFPLRRIESAVWSPMGITGFDFLSFFTLGCFTCSFKVFVLVVFPLFFGPSSASDAFCAANLAPRVIGGLTVHFFNVGTFSSTAAEASLKVIFTRSEPSEDCSPWARKDRSSLQKECCSFELYKMVSGCFFGCPWQIATDLMVDQIV